MISAIRPIRDDLVARGFSSRGDFLRRQLTDGYDYILEIRGLGTGMAKGFYRVDLTIGVQSLSVQAELVRMGSPSGGIPFYPTVSVLAGTVMGWSRDETWNVPNDDVVRDVVSFVEHEGLEWALRHASPVAMVEWFRRAAIPVQASESHAIVVREAYGVDAGREVVRQAIAYHSTIEHESVREPRLADLRRLLDLWNAEERLGSGE